MTIWSLFLAGCGLPFEVSEVDGLRVAQVAANADGAGRLRIPVPFEDGDGVFASNVRSASGTRLYTERMSDDGVDLFVARDWWEAETSLSNGAFAAATTTFNWPILDDVPPSAPRLSIASETGGDPLEVSLFFREAISAGRLPVTITLCGSNAEDVALADALTEAVARWSALYEPLGITLEVGWAAYPEAEDLGPPGRGDDGAHWLAISDGELGRVNVAVVSNIVDWDQAFGVAGDIPGPLIPSERSGVAISAVAAAGADGVYSPSDVRLLGETLAHEVGHYLGLFHPVEIPLDASPIDHWDPLDDTTRCDAVGACEQELGANLMFPYPVCTVSGRCTPQAEVTDGQAAMARRFAGIRP